MARLASKGIPQVLAILSCTADGQVGLKKAVRTYLGVRPGQGLQLRMSGEVLLRANAVGRGRLSLDEKSRLCLPARALDRLEIAGKSLVALIERANGVAVKRFEVLERAGEQAGLVDIETPCALVRTVETDPMPAELLPRLIARHKGTRLRHDISAYLRGRLDFEAWQARRILGARGASAETLRKSLVRQRLDTQEADGSWQGRVTVTARNLRELADLGLRIADPPIRRAVAWLTSRPESEHSPGMFFSTDELVEEQAAVVEQRRRGERARFRKIKVSEQNLVRAADELVRTPCGPRIMWPNALVVEALLRLGCEEAPRVKRALETMLHEWCECGYQHGTGSWRRMTMEELEAFEAGCLHEFRYGGVRDLRELEKADMSRVPFQHPRIAHRATPRGDEYPLATPDHLQGCEVITTRAVSGVADSRMRRFAEAHLWRFASRQRAGDGQFAPEKYGSGLSQAGLLEVFARYDHPASKVVAMRALPWIIESQNDDGSWGEGPSRDADTRAIASVLVRLQDQLPIEMVG
ncbi:MAG: hypothetical protein JSW37_07715 [Anaerolineales bacterium]|nr:MAG: hypothetical protein JSW37_07715 [Anaerolineales bacterium]UCH86110.1 MAG: hypothetical protein JSU97_06110 [Dehalococcoidia bacterium]